MTRDHQWLTRSCEETEALGARLLGQAPPRDTPCRVITLSGDLGAGKSTFVRGALRALGARGPIKSPSYTLMEVYELAGLVAVHLDLYRMRDPAELENLGLADFYLPGHLWLIEWPEKGAGHLPPIDLGFVFSIGENGHRIERVESVAVKK